MQRTIHGTVAAVLAAALFGCDGGASDGAGRRAGDSPAGATGKPGAGLELRFEEPARIAAGEEMPFRLSIAGAPGERVEVRLLGTEGVEVSGRASPMVELDATGSAVIDFGVEVPRPRGCYVIARVTREDGRVAQARCLVGGPAAGVEKPALELEDGRRVRIDPSAER